MVDVADVKSMMQVLARLAEQHIVVVATAGRTQMRGERDFGGAHRPHVQIVDLRDAGKSTQQCSTSTTSMVGGTACNANAGIPATAPKYRPR